MGESTIKHFNDIQPELHKFLHNIDNPKLKSAIKNFEKKYGLKREIVRIFKKEEPLSILAIDHN